MAESSQRVAQRPSVERSVDCSLRLTVSRRRTFTLVAIPGRYGTLLLLLGFVRMGLVRLRLVLEEQRVSVLQCELTPEYACG